MKKIVINNRPELKPFRKELRNHSTSAEATLWTYLQRSQLENRKFRRQHSLGNFIADFIVHPKSWLLSWMEKDITTNLVLKRTG